MKKTIIVVSVIATGVLIWFLVIAKNTPAAPSRLDEFAKCLAEKQITMYGADWCPHCQEEKKRFGTSFQYVAYVECPDNPSMCIAKDIEGYPTWIFPDGKKMEGEQGLKKLSEESNCQLPDGF